MKLQIYSALLTICLSAAPTSSKAASVPSEENCRNAISAGLEQLHRIPPDMTRRDDEDRKKLLEEMERLVETNRRQGVSECQTWIQMMQKAFNQ
ncbi:MAG: hypothetical protein HGB32_09730 [Geobacteraceae bacterium]|nr:hypothetical protein [Geobacteraceae bacterium]NTW80414.1 hypothetical protein [Geobacteraceae bacterium]